jgi:hypothetical protein
MDDQYDEFKVRGSKKSNKFRNSRTTFQEMESAAQRLKQLFEAKMAMQTRKRRKRRVKRESDYKCQKDSAIRYTYLWCSPSVPASAVGNAPYLLTLSLGASNSRPVMFGAFFLVVWRSVNADGMRSQWAIWTQLAECLVAYLNT